MSIIVRSGVGCKDGFTLIELIMTMAILAMTATLLAPFFQAIGHSADPIVRERTVALGQALMDEILSRRWDENSPVGGGPVCTGEGGAGRGTTTYGTPIATCPDPSALNRNATAVPGAEAGENRQSYDDVDDYASMAPEVDNFTDQAGVGFTYTGYSRSVAVDYVASNRTSIDENTPSAGSTTDTKRIRVTVGNPLGEQVVFLSLVCNF